jgi:hypothetical protein
MMPSFLAPVLSAQFILLQTGRPLVIFGLFASTPLADTARDLYLLDIWTP